MTAKTILAGIAFSILWSSAFSTGHIIVANAPPYLSLGLRFLVSGSLAIAIAWMLGQKMDLSRREWIAVGILGICQNTIYLGLCFVALQWVEASIVVVIASLLPLLVAPAHWLIFGEKIGLLGVGGLIAGLAGVGLIMADRVAGGTNLAGIFVAFIGVTALAAATLLVGNAFGRNKNLLMIVGLQMLVGCITVLPISAIAETWSVVWSTKLALAFAWTTLMPGLLATLIWFWLVANIGPTQAAAFHFLNPFFGVAIAALLLGEALSLTDAAGVAVIMAGILAVQLSRQRKAL